MAYSYTPKFRVTGPAGPAVTYDLSTWGYVIRQQVSDSPVFTEHEMVDYSVETTRYGSRRSVQMDFEIPTGNVANETDLMTIMQRALDDEWTVELTLDGGTTYREVVLSSYSGEDLQDKKIGRAFRTVWTVKALQTSPVGVLGGSW